MPISSQDQVNLLKDILNNHQTDCCGSVSECEQLERLVKSLMVNNDIHDNIKNVLQEIYVYSQTGATSGNLDDHITTNQAQLADWVNNIDQFS
ncbi:MAG TPA: YtzH-like family protein [Pseudoneobacillus sp.]|nr:YtzH-like family protein [Pseudoneobacillus sp.]